MVIPVGQHLTCSPLYTRRSRAGMTIPRPCGCGGTRRPGRGNLLCEVCVAEREAYRLCRGCGAEKPPGRGRSYCLHCDPVSPRMMEDGRRVRRCGKCGERNPKPPCQKFCDECQRVEHEAHEARQRARLVLERKACWGCWGPKGPGRRHYCERCQRERSAPRVCPEDGCRNEVPKHCKICPVCVERKKRERRAALNARRDADPAARAEYLRYHRDRYRETGYRPRERVFGERRVRIPAEPLAHALFAACPRGEFVTFAASLGLSDRTVRAWRDDGQQADLSVADRILGLMCWNWFEVWDPERWPDLYTPAEWVEVVAEVAAIFPGERAAV